MTINLETLSEIRHEWALPNLKAAQKDFNKCPTASNWQWCLRAMLVFQQLEYARSPRATIDQGKLMFDLESNPMALWADIICRATLGLSCDEALNQA